MPTTSSREAASRSMASTGLPVDPASSSPSRCSHASSAACSWKDSPQPTKPGGWSSLPTRPPSPSRQPSKHASPHCARSNGWSMPSGLLADPALCSPTCPATRTELLLPTAVSSPSTARASRSNGRITEPSDARYKLMTLDADEFIRRFLIHVLPDGFHRIRHYGLFANANRANNIALARRLLAVPDPTP